LASFCLALAGCVGNAPQVSYYHLNPVESPAAPAQMADAEKALAVGVGPVSFPDVLDRPQIVTRTELNRYRIDEFHRWGGSLQKEFTRVFAENLATLLNTPGIAVFPWEKYFRPRYRVLLEIVRFDGRLGGFAVLDARWTITDGEGRQALQAGKSTIQKAAADSSYAAHAQALGQTLEQLSAKIAGEIQRLEQDSK